MLSRLIMKVPCRLTLSSVWRCDGLPVSCKWQSSISEVMTLRNSRSLALPSRLAGRAGRVCLHAHALCTPAISCLGIYTTKRLVVRWSWDLSRGCSDFPLPTKFRPFFPRHKRALIPLAGSCLLAFIQFQTDLDIRRFLFLLRQKERK